MFLPHAIDVQVINREHGKMLKYVVITADFVQSDVINDSHHLMDSGGS